MSQKKITATIKEQDGGYFFPELDVHVVAKSEDAARKLVKKYYGFNPDEEVARIQSDQEARKSEKNNSKNKPQAVS